MRWDIDPRVSLGPLRAKMPRAECRSVLGSPWSEFRKGPYSENTTDAFNDVGVHAYYDANERLTYVEIHSFGPVTPVLHDVELLGAWDERLGDLERIGMQYHLIEDDSAQLDGVGIRLYRYDPSESEVLSVAIELPSEDDIPWTPPTAP